MSTGNELTLDKIKKAMDMIDGDSDYFAEWFMDHYVFEPLMLRDDE